MNCVKMMCGVMLAMGMLFGSVGCSTTRPPEQLKQMNQRCVLHEDPAYPDLTEHLGGDDSCEGFNRAMYATNRVLLLYLVRPIGWVWTSIMPRPGQVCIGNFFHNVEYPIRLFSSLFQAKFCDAGTETLRFFSNTIIGIGGFFDPAFYWFDIEKSEEDFAQTFWSWGIGQGAFMHFPILGPSSVRDAVGYLFDMAFDPKTYVPVPGIGGFAAFSRVLTYYRAFDSVDNSYYDPYELSKRFYVVMRYMKHHDYDRYSHLKNLYESSLMDALHAGAAVHETPPSVPTQHIPRFFRQGRYIDTLKYLCFTPDEPSIWPELSLWNSDFYFQCSRRTVSIDENRPALPYRLWMQADTAPLFVLIPGTGSDCSSVEGAAVGKLAYEAGYNVVLIPNTLNTNFYLAATHASLPGYLPDDLRDVRIALNAILDDLKARDDYVPPHKVLGGLSLGATHALALAATESDTKADHPISFDRYIACSPAVRLGYSAPEIDRCADAWAGWSDTELFDRSVMAMAKFTTLAFLNDQARAAAEDYVETKDSIVVADLPLILPFTDTEAQILIAYSFHITLSELVVCAIKNDRIQTHELPTDNGTTEMYRRLNHLNFRAYYERMLPHFYEQDSRPISSDVLQEGSSLLQYTDALKNNPKIRITHAWDDFIVNPDDLKWIKRIAPETSTIYDAGGHMGYLPYRAFHAQFIQNLKL